MITLRTISAGKRRVLFVIAALADLCARLASATVQHDLVLFMSGPQIDLTSVSAATGVAVPTVVAPLILSPIAYLLGHVLVVEEAQYVRFVSATFIVGSFLCYLQTPALSVLLSVLAYLILGSGMIRSRSLGD